MRYTIFAALALSLTLGGASPAPRTSNTSRSQVSNTAHSQTTSQASTQTATPSRSQTASISSTQTETSTSSGVSFNGRYLITHADISQHQGDIIPAHNTTATIIQTIETFDILVQGTFPRALPVQCNATWIATLASPTNNPIGTQFSCSDPAVSALMLRQDSDPSIGWWIMVEFKYEKLLVESRCMG